MATPLNTRLKRLIASASAAITWERAWPALAPMVGVVALFVGTALMGLWAPLPPVAKAVGLAAFAALFVLAALRVRRLTLPAREDALRRLEEDAALPHRPLGTYEDQLAGDASDPVTRGLWQLHRQRARARLAKLRFAVPRATLVPHDPFALRTFVGIVLFVGIAVGAGAVAERLITPFDFSDPAAGRTETAFRLDAWVTPPAYTRKAPLFLSSRTRVETVNGIAVPAGSVLTVQAQGAEGLDLLVSGAAGERAEGMTALGTEPGEALAGAVQGLVEIDGPMAVEVRREGVTVDGWQFRAEGDTPPTATLTNAPEANRRGGFELRYTLDDDYGIVAADAFVTPSQAGEGRRPLVDNPTFTLTLPSGPGLRGAARTAHDLSRHPFAGMEVTVKVRATDGLGQTGYSGREAFRLPARTFVNPVAKALVEQRRILALDANRHTAVLDAMDLILLEPEGIGSPGAFLAVRAAYGDLVAARTDDDLREMLDRLWELALMLEDDGMSDAQRALEAAQERLRQAMEDGATPEEIARLMQELREAMQQYLQALAQRGQQQQQQNSQNQQNSQQLTQQSLDDLMNRIEELARQGRMDEAEALLAELAQMMQNLQVAEGQQGEGNPMGQDGQTLDELGRMIQRQQQLMDETFGMGQNPGQQGEGQEPGNQPGQRPGEGQFGQQPGQQPGQGQNGQMSPSERADALRRLQEQQQALRQELQNLMQRLEEQGFEPGDRLGDAGQSMGDAGDALGEGQSGQAVDEQGEALRALREGAQDMAQQLAEAQGQPGPGQQRGQPDANAQRDPLGRSRREGGYVDTSRVGIPDEIDTQRARRILQELRKRLGDVEIPRLERDYLERLIP
ncbi:MAG: TIGR02302 family protein [Pseudomonadota bacterium]